MKSSMVELNNEIKSNKLGQLYLLYGAERFLVRLYEGRIRQAVAEPTGMNEELFEGRNTSAQDIKMAALTLPLMAPRRLVLVRDSGLFAAGRKDESDKIASFLESVPTTTILVFVEEDVDKRLRSYKKATEHGRIVDFEKPSDEELVRWIVRRLQEHGKSIHPRDASQIASYAGQDMYTISSELDKLAAYAIEAERITTQDIEAVCNKTSQARIFELLDAAVAKSPKVISLLDELVADTHPLAILTMLQRQYRLMLICADCAQNGMRPAQIAVATGMRPFQVQNALRHAQQTSRQAMLQALEACAQTDYNIKTGRLPEHLALELLLLLPGG